MQIGQKQERLMGPYQGCGSIWKAYVRLRMRLLTLIWALY